MKQDEKQPLNMLKQEYDHIPVPEQARVRMMTGISQAKKAKRGMITMRFTKQIGGTAAAAMIAITLLANLSPTTANAMERIPVIGSIAKVVTFRTFEDQKGNFEADIKVPQVAPDTTGKAPVPANQSIKDYADQLISAYEKELADSNGVGHYGINSTYKVITDNSKYLSIRIDTTLTMADGTQFVKIFNIDKSTGTVVTLSDLLKDKPGALKAISDNIKEQMGAQMAADPNMMYFYHSDMPDEDFKSLTGNESYYLNDKGELVIAFNEGDVAPSYMGAVEFTIPSSVTGSF